MTTTTKKGPIVDPGLCRCCGALKKCRLLNVEYQFLGQREVYSEMFVDCFGLLLSNLDGKENQRVICATCVVRLRDACSFRQQVLRCEERLLQANIQVHGDGALLPELETTVKVEFIDPETPLEQELVSEVTEDVPMDTQDTHDNREDDGDDMDCPLSELPKKVKKSPKKKKRLGRKALNGECIVKERKRRKTALKELEPILPPPPKKTIDTEHRSIANCITIVENSFVCPFDSSFSDYYCIYCREVFTDPNKLREHTLTHDPSTFKDCIQNKKLLLVDILRIDCRICAKRIDDIDLFKHHLTKIHGKTLFQTSNDFLKFRLTDNNLTCTECDSSFSFFHALKKHMAEHFGTCICDICGAKYFEERMLILHQKTHQKIDESFPCQICDKVFKSKHSRYLHESKLHKKEPAYQCYKCDAVLFSYSLRYRHMIEAHGEQRLFKCELCDRSYDSRKSLREHNRRNHLKIFKHACEFCDKRFYLPSRLKEHIVSHTGERNFRCEFCGKSYPRLRGLQVHMQCHLSEKRFRCNLCNATFTQNVNLKNHLQKQHQNNTAIL